MKRDKPTVEIARNTYQPSKAELERDMRIDTMPEKLAKALFKPQTIKTVRRPKD